MRLELTGRHVDITPALRRLVDRKIDKLERLLNDSAVSAQVVLTREKLRHRTEITVHARGEKFLHGVGHSATWEASLSDAIDKITRQAQKVKGKWQERKRRGAKPIVEPSAAPAARRVVAAEVVRPRMPRVLQTSRQAVKPMSIAEAAREIDEGGLGVVVFRDQQTAAISVLYRRVTGELALVETES